MVFFELQNFALHVDRDFARKVATRDGRCHFGDVTNLIRQVAAIEFTESVRSFHTPATPLTSACPPSLPSVPTSRATRVTSRRERTELIDHGVDHAGGAYELALQRAAFYFERHFFERSPCATAPMTRAISVEGCTRSEIRLLTDSMLADHAPEPELSDARCPMRPSLPTAVLTRASSVASFRSARKCR